MPRKFNDAIDLAANELQNVVVQNLGSDPGTGVVDGRLYYSTALSALRLRAGGSWTSLASGAGYSDEQAVDAAAAALAAGTHTGGIGVTYDDSGNSISLTLDNNEAFQDIVGAFLETDTGSTGITATYDDANGRMNFAVAYGAVTAQTAFGASSGNGAADTAARSDHTHGTPVNPVTAHEAAGDPHTGYLLESVVSGIATPAIVLGTAAAAGTGTTPIHHNATIAAFDATVPTTIAFGAGAAVGSAAFAARRDHTHGAPANPVTYAAPAFVLGTANAAGAAATLVRSDATIAIFDATAPSTETFGQAAAVGSAAFAARRDHLHGVPAHGDTAHNAVTLSALSPPTAAFGFNAQRITGLADPAAAQDAATKAYVDATVTAQTWKNPVDAATTGALPSLTYASGPGTLTATANAALAAQDGVTLAVGDDLLVKNQTNSFENGIYTVTQVGSGAAPFILTRRADANTAVELRDAALMVEGGTTLGGDIYTQTNATLADLTAATQTWVKTGDTNTVYTADGTTIALTGNSFSVAANGISGTQLNTSVAGNGLTGGGGSALAVNVDNTTVEISTDTVRIAAGAAGAGLIGGGGSALAVGAGTGILSNANDVAVNHAVVPFLFVQTLTGGATSEVVTHNLGTRDVIVRVYGLNTPWAEEEFTVEHTSTNTITIRSAISIPASTYRVVVFG